MLLHRLDWGVVLHKRNIENFIRGKCFVARKEHESCFSKQRRLKYLNVFTLTKNIYLACHRHCSTAHDSRENGSVGQLTVSSCTLLPELEIKQENLFTSICTVARSNFVLFFMS